MVVKQTDNEKQQDAQKQGVTSALREKSLKAAGVGFLVADSALIASGLMAGENKVASAGIFGLSAGFVGTRYGNPKAEKKLEQIYRRLGAHLEKEGIEIPKNPTAAVLSKKGGLMDSIEAFLYAHPSQVMNVFYGLIGAQFFRNGMEIKSRDMKFSGSLMMAGALAGLLVHEKKPDPAHPPEGGLQKAWSWVQEKPLRLSGSLFTANQFFLAKHALSERKAGKPGYAFKLAAVAAFVFGNTMFALSSKSEAGEKGLDEKTLNSLADTAALVIAAQPPEQRSALLEHVAGYLATDPAVNMKAADISAILHKKIDDVAATLPEKAGVSDKQWQNRVEAAPAASQHSK